MKTKLRVGDRMFMALRAVYGPTAFRSKHELAVWIGPHGSNRYGDAAVMRCITAGLLRLDPTSPHASPRGKGAPVLTEAGRRAVEEGLLS